MKRLRYLVVLLLLFSLVGLIGCLPNDDDDNLLNPNSIRGTWKSIAAIGGHVLEIRFEDEIGDEVPLTGLFSYTYKTTVKWGTKQWVIMGDDADAAEFCWYIGTASENTLLVLKIEGTGEEAIVHFSLAAKHDGNKLYIKYLAIDNEEFINNGDVFGPEYLTE